jgi:hypothetical protein
LGEVVLMRGEVMVLDRGRDSKAKRHQLQVSG